MSEEMLKAVLEAAQAKSDKDGWSVLPDGRFLTLYAAHNGAPLTVAKVEAIRVVNGLIRARSAKGQTFFLAQPDVFAVAFDGGAEAAAGRKAGFLG